MSDSQSYEALPYWGGPVRESHPDHCGALAALHGMRPAAPDACRVLEIGCGDGANLLPMALDLPGSEFVGLDLAAVHIEAATAASRELELGNTRFLQQDLMAAGEELGRFDYIIAHGLYSWVPPAVQQRLLELCGRLLAPQGVVYLSYNTFPGWHLKLALRDLMRFASQGSEDPRQRVTQALDFLDTAAACARSLPEGQGQFRKAWAALLDEARSRLRGRTPSYLFHEYLETDNSPVRFSELVRRAGAAGLQYLCDSQFHTMSGVELPAELRQRLDQLPGLIEREQLLDQLRQRNFRMSLLCPRAVELRRTTGPESLDGLRLSSPAVRAAPERGRSDQALRFEVPEVASFKLTSPIEQQVLLELSACWPRALAFDELGERVRQQLANEPQRTLEELPQRLAGFVFELLGHNCARLHLCGPRVLSAPGPTPRVSPLARLQALRGSTATNQLHESVKLEPPLRALLPALDGTRDQRAAVAWLLGRAREGAIELQAGGEPIGEAALAREIERVWQASLPWLSRAALLCP